nr:MAG TPA: hypothetical protein [Caudoviricetes sp.]
MGFLCDDALSLLIYHHKHSHRQETKNKMHIFLDMHFFFLE